jgi:hypothetical protein
MGSEMLPPLLYPSSNRTERLQHQRLKDEGLIRPIGPRLYTSLEESEVETVVPGNWMTIVSNLFPKALVSHRSALELKTTSTGIIFLIGNTNREVKYANLTLKIFERTRCPS